MDWKKRIRREKIYNIIIPILCAVLPVIIQNNQEQAMVKSLVGRFENVEENMELEQALEMAIKERGDLEQTIDSISNENVQLKNQLEDMVDANIYSPALVIEGLKKENSIGKGVVEVDGNTYFSSDMCWRIWENKPVFDKTNNVVFFSENNEVLTESKVDLIDENVIYDGKYLTIYQPSKGETFSMGSDTFNKGFTIGSDNYSIFGEGNGYALFDLKGKYSKLYINVARVNRSDLGIEDATLKVYLNGEYKTEYSLSGQKPPTAITIDLNYADNLKLEVCGSKIVYGFANCTLEK